MAEYPCLFYVDLVLTMYRKSIVDSHSLTSTRVAKMWRKTMTQVSEPSTGRRTSAAAC
jgi:hypothetical protein